MRNEFSKKIEKLEFEIVKPNLANISKSLTEPLKQLINITNSHKTSITLKAPENSFHVFNQKMSEFGSHVVIIKNSKEFMDRIVQKLRNLEIKFTRDFVKYVSMRDHHGVKDFFTKDKIYQYQKEYRIFLDTTEANPYSFQIGSIEDIAEIFEVNTTKEISMKDGKLLLHML